jgi:hypothetical protein
MENKIADDNEGGELLDEGLPRYIQNCPGRHAGRHLRRRRSGPLRARPGQRPAPAALAMYSAPTASAQSVIAANWMAFFDPKTPVAKRISLLQDGQQFAAVIRSQPSSGLAAQASAKVTSVTLVSATRAKVVSSLSAVCKTAG